MNIKEIKQKLLQLDTGKRVRFMVLFGSVAERRETPLSDVDIAVYYDGDPEERFQFRVKALGMLPKAVDVQVFQDLPLAVQHEVLRGRALYYDNFQFMFKQFMNVIKNYNYFERYLNEYYAALEGPLEAASGTY